MEPSESVWVCDSAILRFSPFHGTVGLQLLKFFIAIDIDAMGVNTLNYVL